MLRDIVEIFWAYIQYFLLLVNIAPSPFPGYYTAPADFLRYVNLDFSLLLNERKRDGILRSVPDLIPLDVRTGFVVVSVCLPLLVSFTSLLVLSGKLFIFWYTCCLLGVFFLVAGLASTVSPDANMRGVISETEGTISLYSGVATLLACSIVGAVRIAYGRWKQHRRREKLQRRERKLQAAKKLAAVASAATTSAAAGKEKTAVPAAAAAVPPANVADQHLGLDPTAADVTAGLGPGATIKADDEFEGLAVVRKREVASVNLVDQLMRGVYFSGFLLLAMLFLGVVTIPGVNMNADTKATRSLYTALGVIFLIVAAILVGWFFLGFSNRGRNMLFDIKSFLHSNFLSVLLLLVTGLYVPAVSYIVIVMNCNDFSCPVGTRLPVEGSVVTASNVPTLVSLTALAAAGLWPPRPLNGTNNSETVARNTSLAPPLFSAVPVSPSTAVHRLNGDMITTDNSSAVWGLAGAFHRSSTINVSTWVTLIDAVGYPESVCQLCDFSPWSQRCPMSLQMELSQRVDTGRRLEYDARIHCEAMWTYLWPASVIMFFSFVILLPIVNLALTNLSVRRLAAEFPLDSRQTTGYTEDELFSEKVHASDNVAKFIYDPFHRRFRHWKILFLFQKMGIVFVSVYVFRGSGTSTATIGIAGSLGIHFATLVYVVIVRPFKRKVENYLTIATQVMLTITATVGQMALQLANVPDAVMTAIAVFAFVSPVLSISIGAILTFNDELAQEKAREERIIKAQEAAEADEGDADEAENSTDDLEVSSRSDSGSAIGAHDRHRSGNPHSQSPESGGTLQPGLASLPSWSRPGGPKSNDKGSNINANTKHNLTTPAKGTAAPSETPFGQSPTTKKPFVTSASTQLMGISSGAAPHPLLAPRPGAGALPALRLGVNNGGNSAGGAGAPSDQLHSPCDPAAWVGGVGNHLLLSAQRAGRELTLSPLYPVNNGGSGGGLGPPTTFPNPLTPSFDFLDPESHRANGVGHGSFGGRAPPFLSLAGSPSTATPPIAPTITVFSAPRPTEKLLPSDAKASNTLASSPPPTNSVVASAASTGGGAAATPVKGGGAKKLGGVWAKARAGLLNKIRAEEEERVRKEEEEERRREEEAQAARKKAEAERKARADAEGLEVTDVYDMSAIEPTSFVPEGASNKKRKKGRFGGKVMKNWDGLLEALRNEDTRKQIRANLDAQAAEESAAEARESSAKGGGSGASGASGAAGGFGVAGLGPLGGAGGAGGVAAVSAAERRLIEKQRNKRLEQQLRNKLRTMYEEHLGRIRMVQEEVDFRINVETTSVLQLFFFVGSVFAFGALLWCIAGFWSHSSQAQESGVMPRRVAYPRHVDNFLSGYGSWENYTENCCCTAFVNQTGYFPHWAVDIERWFCRNGKIRERVRRQTVEHQLLGIVTVDSYHIRPLCGMTFEPTCAPVVRTIDDRSVMEFNFSACDWDRVLRAGVSEDAAAQTLREQLKELGPHNLTVSRNGTLRFEMVTEVSLAMLRLW